jgi:hypothetical protein
MQAYFLVTDGVNEIRIPLPANASVRAVVPWMGAGPETKSEPPAEPAPKARPVFKGLPTQTRTMKATRAYTHDFRAKAVALALSGAGAARVCAAMGIPPSTMDGWISRHRASQGACDLAG